MYVADTWINMQLKGNWVI